MICSHTRKFVFMKASRTAGTSMQLAFEQHCNYPDFVTRGGVPELDGPRPPCHFIGRYGHLPLQTFLDAALDGDRLRLAKYFVFFFVRNPWDRAVSKFWAHQKAVARIGEPWTIPKARRAFGEWIANRPDISMMKWVLVDGKPWPMDFIGRFENLLGDYERACNAIGVPVTPLPEVHTDRKKIKAHYSVFYDDKTRDRVARYCKKDIKLFGYDFEKIDLDPESEDG